MNKTGIQRLTLRLGASLAALLLLAGCTPSEGNGDGTTTGDVTTTTGDVTTTTATATTTIAPATNSTTQKPTTTGTTKSTRRTVSTVNKTTTSNNWDELFPVEQTKTPAQLAQMVTHVGGTVLTQVKKETVAITTFNKEYAFTHHPGIAYFKGKIYAMFSQHVFGEDYPGQRVVVASSSDFYNWSEPQVVSEAFDGTVAKTSLVPSGIYVADDKLFCTFYSHDYGAAMFDSSGTFKGGGDDAACKTTVYISFTTDGKTWSTPAKCAASPNNTLRKTYFGRWLSNDGPIFYYTDEEPDGFFWEKTGMTGQQITAARNKVKQIVKYGIFSESTWYQTKDNVLFLMTRTNTGVMWLSQSYDGGDTWTDSNPTNFSSSNNQFPMGELPNGDIYAVGTPYNKANDWEQWPLNLYVSKDGYNFDKGYTISDEKYNLKQAGYSKGGYFGYPHVLLHDGYMYVLHSKQKEVMEIHRIKLSDIV